MMKRVVTGAAVTLVLAGCTPKAEPVDADSPSPSPAAPSAPGPTAHASEADLEAVCDALENTVTLPGDGTVRYAAKFYHPKTATNAPMCDIEPDGEYYDVATKVPTFVRAKFDYSLFTEAERPMIRLPKYTSETDELLTLNQADPLTAEDLPCVAGSCKNGIHGYQYNFRFGAIMGNISVIAEFDYITTDVKGDKKPQYRTQAIKEFKASMEVIAAGLK